MNSRVENLRLVTVKINTVCSWLKKKTMLPKYKMENKVSSFNDQVLDSILNLLA